MSLAIGIGIGIPFNYVLNAFINSDTSWYFGANGLAGTPWNDLSRTGLGTRIGPTGLVEYGPHNLVQQSEDLSAAPWNKSAGITAAAAAGPGGFAAKRLTASATGVFNGYYTPFSVGTQQTTAQLTVKYEGWRWLCLIGASGSASDCAWFDLLNGAVGQVNGAPTADLEVLADGWLLLSLVSPVLTTAYYQFFLADANGSTTATAHASNAVVVAKPQYNLGATALDYIPTTTTARYLPRITYDPVTLASEGLLVEGAGTNLLGMTEAFDDAYWTKSATTITANTGTAPSGATTADTAAFASQYASVGRSVSGLGIGTVVTFSMWVQYLSGNTALHLNADEGGAAVTRTAFAATSDWQRITVTRTLTTGTATFSIQDRNGSGFGSVRIWGAQLETGSVPTSYIPNAGTGTAVRVADDWKLTGAALTAAFAAIQSAGAGTLVVEFVVPSSSAGARYLAASSNLSRRYCYANPSNITWNAYDGVNVGDFGALTAGSTTKIAISFSGTAMSCVANGGSVDVKASNGNFLTPADFCLGWGAGHLNSTIKSARLIPGYITGAALQALTA